MKKKSLKATVWHLSRTQSGSCIFCFWLQWLCRFASRLLSAVPPTSPHSCASDQYASPISSSFFLFPHPSWKLISITISKLFSCYWLSTNQSSKGRILHWFALTLGSLFVPSPFPSRFSQTKNWGVGGWTKQHGIMSSIARAASPTTHPTSIRLPRQSQPHPQKWKEGITCR